MKIKHKEIKRCKTIMASMIKDHGIGPGTLFITNDERCFYEFNFEVDERGVAPFIDGKKYYALPNITLHKGEAMMFIDVVYDARHHFHVLRFLHKDKIIALLFKKGKTIKNLKTNFKLSGVIKED